MTDILISAIILCSIPFILRRPYFGIVMWIWISVMNPHTLGWGFTRTFPFAAIIAVTTLFSMLLSRDSKSIPWTPVTVVLVVFVAWMCGSTLFSYFPDESMVQWNKVMKIMLMTMVVFILVRTRQQIQGLVWVLVLSLGFYGVKGGLFTLVNGGQFRVWGPTGTFIEGNNELALALISAIPLMYYVYSTATKKWVRPLMAATIVLSAFAALGSHSRGALLAIVAMAGFLWLKSSQKLKLGMVLMLLSPLMIAFMPDNWSDRMDTISRYDEDESALGRLNAWWMAWNLAKDHPLFGGGFAIYNQLVFNLYAPDPTQVRAAHSIYFQALGEHGFGGLALYLLLGVLTWRTGSWIIRHTAKVEELRWAHDLARMVQVGLVGFAVGGAFLSLLYFDVPYYLLALLVATQVLVRKELQQAVQSRSAVAEGAADASVSASYGHAGLRTGRVP